MLNNPEPAASSVPEASDRVKEYQDPLEDFGPAKAVDLLGRKEEAGLGSYIYRLTFKDGHVVKLNLKLTEKDKIAALDVME